MEALRLLAAWVDPPPIDQSLGRYAPLPPREKSSIKSSLNRELPHLLSLKDEISEAAMNLAKQYDVEVEAP